MNWNVERIKDRYIVTVNTSKGKTTFRSKHSSYVAWKFNELTGLKLSFDKILEGSDSAENIDTESHVFTNVEKIKPEFCINQRFTFVESVVQLVSSKVQASAVITGEGGLGKTFTVLNTLEKAGFKDLWNAPEGFNADKCYIQIKGFSTAKNLFRTLYENNGLVIVFDDMDNILKDPISVNLLKAALDSYDKRVITWGSETRGADDDLPRSFEFTGQIIFISNLNQDRIDQAIRSRSMLVDLSMTLDDKIERMQTLIQDPEFLPEYSAEIKEDALKFIDTNKNTAREISLRTLITVSKVRSSDEDWENLAKYLIC